LSAWSPTDSQVREYVPPFSFEVNPTNPPTLSFEQGTRIHPIIVLVYKQRNGRVNMADEFQAGCNSGFVTKRVGDYNELANKYNLELVAGNFFWTTYTPATNTLLCYAYKCSGEPLPFLVPGVNDGPECRPSGEGEPGA